MDPTIIIAALVSGQATVLAAWIARRTNGQSPLAKKLDCMDAKLQAHIDAQHIHRY